MAGHVQSSKDSNSGTSRKKFDASLRTYRTVLIGRGRILGEFAPVSIYEDGDRS